MGRGGPRNLRPARRRICKMSVRALMLATMRDPISIRSLLSAIRALRADRPIDTPGKWYRTQKQHWIGWLSEYAGPGFYGRQAGVKRDAKFAYNHIVEPKMLLYLSTAAGVDRRLLIAAKRTSARSSTLMQKSAAIRCVIPWETVAAALWSRYRSP
jgi:hypothetical protein